MAGTVLRGALVDGRARDVTIVDGMMASIVDGTGGGTDGIDLAGYVLLPSAVEPHAHLDKAFLGDSVANPTGDLVGAIDAMHTHHQSTTVVETRDRAVRAGRLMARNGYTSIRTHVDVTMTCGLVPMEAVLAARTLLAGVVEIQVVALCGSPVVGAGSAEQQALLREALDMGADLVGGCPHLEPEGTRAATEFLLALAADHGLGVDLHTDETLDPTKLGILDLIEAVDAGFPHPVTASHCVSLGMLPETDQQRLAEEIARTGIGVVTNPATNLYLQGRADRSAVPRGLTAIAALRAAGVAVAAGQDNVQDPFNPLGRGDPLEIAALMTLAAHLDVADAYGTVSTTSRAVLGLPAVNVAPGSPADLLAVRARSLREAIAFAPNGDGDRLVFRRGELVSSVRPAGAHNS